MSFNFLGSILTTFPLAHLGTPAPNKLGVYLLHWMDLYQFRQLE